MPTITLGSSPYTVAIDTDTGGITATHHGASWHLAGPVGGFGAIGLPGRGLNIGPDDGVPLKWRPAGKSLARAEGKVPNADLVVRLTYSLSGGDRLKCRIDLDGPDARKLEWVAFPNSPQLSDPAARLVVPQWLGLLVSPSGPDILVHRTVYLRPMCMRFMGAVASMAPDAPACICLLEDSLARSLEIRRDHGVVGFRYLGETTYQDQRRTTRSQELEFRFLGDGYVGIAAAYRKHMQARPDWRTLTARRNACDPARIAGATMFGHIPCDYGQAEPLTFDALVPRLRALKAGGLERAIFHIGGWNRDGYDNHYPDILPANPRCGGDDGMRRLTEAMDELGYVCTPHDDLAIISTDSPAFDPRWVSRTPGGVMHNGGVYRNQQYHIATAEAQTHFAERNMPEVHRRFPHLDGYLFDVLTSYQPLEDYVSIPPLSREQELAARSGSLRVARREFARFIVCESITDWAIENLDAAFMAEEGYIHRGDGGWAVDELHGEIVPIWELVYHDVLLGVRESTTHVNSPMETQDPFVRYLRILLKTLRAGTLPPCFYSDDLRLGIIESYRTARTTDCGGWDDLTGMQMVAAAGKLATWLGDAVFTSPMVDHRFAEGSLYHEVTRFDTPAGPVTVTVNTALEAWSPEPGWRLPPLGFIIRGPGLLLYHAEEAAGHRFGMATLAGGRGSETWRAFGDREVVIGTDPLKLGRAKE